MPGRSGASAATRTLGDKLFLLGQKAPALLAAIEILVDWVLGEIET